MKTFAASIVAITSRLNSPELSFREITILKQNFFVLLDNLFIKLVSRFCISRILSINVLTSFFSKYFNILKIKKPIKKHLSILKNLMKVPMMFYQI